MGLQAGDLDAQTEPPDVYHRASLRYNLLNRDRQAAVTL